MKIITSGVSSDESLGLIKENRVFQAQGKYPGNFGGEQHFLPHCECLRGWGGISCGSSADPLAGSVVRESSVIGP